MFIKNKRGGDSKQAPVIFRNLVFVRSETIHIIFESGTQQDLFLSKIQSKNISHQQNLTEFTFSCLLIKN